jgi:hypothetical protein
MAIWYIVWLFGITCGTLVYLWLFGITCGTLVYFMVIWYMNVPRFGMMYEEKSGNPASIDSFGGNTCAHLEAAPLFHKVFFSPLQ